MPEFVCVCVGVHHCAAAVIFLCVCREWKAAAVLSRSQEHIKDEGGENVKWYFLFFFLLFFFFFFLKLKSRSGWWFETNNNNNNNNNKRPYLHKRSSRATLQHRKHCRSITPADAEREHREEFVRDLRKAAHHFLCTRAAGAPLQQRIITPPPEKMWN